MPKNLLHLTRVLITTSYYLLVTFPLVVSAAVHSPQDDNDPPAVPELIAPFNGDTVSLTPTLTAGDFYDADGDSHVGSRYQIALDGDFIDLVFDEETTLNLTRLTLVDLILDPESVYYWRVKFIDDRGGESPWSPSYTFSTIDYATAGDEDANGILDSQEVMDMSVDLDQDQIPDATQTDLLCVNTSDTINPHISVKAGNTGSQVVAVRAITAPSMGHAMSLNQPQTLTGLISVKIFLDPDETVATITLYLTTEAPEDAQYYYQTEDGWAAYSNVTFSDDRRSVTVTLEDGGEGDQDSVENGVIVDPAGLGYSSQASGTANSMSVTEQTTCFIATSFADANGHWRLGSAFIIGILFGLGGMMMALRQRT